MASVPGGVAHAAGVPDSHELPFSALAHASTVAGVAPLPLNEFEATHAAEPCVTHVL